MANILVDRNGHLRGMVLQNSVNDIVTQKAEQVASNYYLTKIEYGGQGKGIRGDGRDSGRSETSSSTGWQGDFNETARGSGLTKLPREVSTARVKDKTD